MYEDSITTLNVAKYQASYYWDFVWPEKILMVFFFIVLFWLFLKVFRLARQGVALFKGGQKWYMGLADMLLKSVGMTLTLAVLAIGILVWVDYGNDEDVTQHHDLWEGQVERFPEMIRGVALGPDYIIEVADTLPAVETEFDSLGNPIEPVSPVVISQPPVVDSIPDEGAEEASSGYGWIWYSLGIIYAIVIITMVGTYVKSKKYKTAAITAGVGLLIATLFRSYILPDEWASSFGFYSMLWGFLVIAHWYWRHSIINVPMAWNIDPESPENKRGPQKHWFGLWGNFLFHLCLLLVFGPFTMVMWKTGIPAFFLLLVTVAYVIIILKYVLKLDIARKTKDIGLSIWRWTTSASAIGKVLGIFILLFNTIIFFASMAVLVFFFLIFMIFKKKDVISRGMENVWNWWFGSAVRWWQRPAVGMIIRIMLVLIALAMFIGLFFVNLPILFLAVLALPLAYILGGIYAPHIRGRLVPMFFKKPIFSRFWLLGKEYLDSGGLKVTLLPSWLWGFNMFLIDYSVWEIEEIQTSKIPTKGKGGKAGVIIDLLMKITLQVFDPRTYLEMREEDRSQDGIRKVIMRYVLDAVRDYTQLFEYDAIKTKKVYQFPVRYDDRALMAPDDPLRKKYDKLALLDIKVKDIVSREYVKANQPGVYVKATFIEYLDWLLKTLTGCQVVELGILDATAEDIEKAEQELKVSEIQKKIKANLGEAAGLQHAKEIAKISELLGTGKAENELAATLLTNLIGAKEASVLFKLVTGLGNKVSS